MVAEKSCNLSKLQVALPRDKGSVTFLESKEGSWASLDEHLPKQYV